MKSLFAVLVLVAGSFCTFAVNAAEVRPPDGLVVVTEVDDALAGLLAENDAIMAKVSDLNTNIVEVAQKTGNQDEKLYERYQTVMRLVSYAAVMRVEAEFDALVDDVPVAVTKVTKSNRLLKLAVPKLESVLADLKKTDKNDA